MQFVRATVELTEEIHIQDFNEFLQFSEENAHRVTGISFGEPNIPVILSDFMFSKFPNVWMLNLCECAISELPEKIFYGLPNLVHVACNKNFIKKLPDGLFSENLNLKEVYFYQNLLEELPADLFENNLQVCQVALGRNRLTVIDAKVFPENVSTIYLEQQASGIVHTTKGHPIETEKTFGLQASTSEEGFIFRYEDLD